MPTLAEIFVGRQSELRPTQPTLGNLSGMQYVYDYQRFPYKGQTEDQPYVFKKLPADSLQITSLESRMNPIAPSAIDDVVRMTKFSLDFPTGVVFLGKQQLLQTGNTFAQTRLYNPANSVIHAAPFVHLKRHIDIKQTIASIQGGSSTNYATLQKETYDPTAERARNRLTRFGGIENQLLIDGSGESAITNQFSSGPTQFNLRDFGRGVKNKATGRLLDIVSSIKSTAVSGYNAQFNSPNETEWEKSRPELMLAGKDKPPVSYYDRLSGLAKTNTPEEGMYSDVDEVTGQSFKDLVAEYNNAQIIKTSVNDDGIIKAKESRYYKDAMQTNFSIFVDGPDTTTDPTNDDTIDVIFSNVRKSTEQETTQLSHSNYVRFRAFIQDINESVKPTYNENKYIGRYETFYTYNKVTRDLSFKLTLQAFSKVEIQQIIQKMSYLTSHAYPTGTGASGKYLTPNIFMVTIGNLYKNQPCLLQSVTHTIENDSSWDIEDELPMRVIANISLRLLDKNEYSPLEMGIYANTDLLTTIWVSNYADTSLTQTQQENLNEVNNRFRRLPTVSTNSITTSDSLRPQAQRLLTNRAIQIPLGDLTG